MTVLVHAPADTREVSAAALACKFCTPRVHAESTLEVGTVFAVPDLFPVTAGHHVVVPRRHSDDFFSLTDAERADTLKALDLLRACLLAADPSIVGFNIGMNCGEAAGQTVPHTHTHLIPRRHGDTPAPRGGVRGVVPARMSY
jgi:ATP adenylyltransferase